MSVSKVITIQIPSSIPENYNFKEVNDINQLINDGYQLLKIDQSKDNKNQYGFTLTMFKQDSPAPIQMSRL
jgi:hypothetical protein